MTMIRHPHCKVCGWAKGGVDSWDGKACKCGNTEPAISTTVAMDRMWRDPATRSRFEAETELTPDEAMTEPYQSRFRAWASKQIAA